MISWEAHLDQFINPRDYDDKAGTLYRYDSSQPEDNTSFIFFQYFYRAP
jgi:hypothetical protein